MIAAGSQSANALESPSEWCSATSGAANPKISPTSAKVPAASPKDAPMDVDQQCAFAAHIAVLPNGSNSTQ